jgi:hypothetical protein
VTEEDQSKDDTSKDACTLSSQQKLQLFFAHYKEQEKKAKTAGICDSYLLLMINT